MLWCSAAAAQLKPEADQAQTLVESIAADPSLENAVVGICAMAGDGRILVNINANTMMLPASNIKLISTGAAIHKLGPEYRFETAIGHDGVTTPYPLNRTASIACCTFTYSCFILDIS